MTRLRELAVLALCWCLILEGQGVHCKQYGQRTNTTVATSSPHSTESAVKKSDSATSTAFTVNSEVRSEKDTDSDRPITKEEHRRRRREKRCAAKAEEHSRRTAKAVTVRPTTACTIQPTSELVKETVKTAAAMIIETHVPLIMSSNTLLERMNQALSVANFPLRTIPTLLSSKSISNALSAPTSSPVSESFQRVLSSIHLKRYDESLSEKVTSASNHLVNLLEMTVTSATARLLPSKSTDKSLHNSSTPSRTPFGNLVMVANSIVSDLRTSWQTQFLATSVPENLPQGKGPHAWQRNSNLACDAAISGTSAIIPAANEPWPEPLPREIPTVVEQTFAIVDNTVSDIIVPSPSPSLIIDEEDWKTISNQYIPYSAGTGISTQPKEDPIRAPEGSLLSYGMPSVSGEELRSPRKTADMTQLVPPISVWLEKNRVRTASRKEKCIRKGLLSESEKLSFQKMTTLKLKLSNNIPSNQTFVMPPFAPTMAGMAMALATMDKPDFVRITKKWFEFTPIKTPDPSPMKGTQKPKKCCRCRRKCIKKAAHQRNIAVESEDTQPKRRRCKKKPNKVPESRYFTAQQENESISTGTIDTEIPQTASRIRKCTRKIQIPSKSDKSRCQRKASQSFNITHLSPVTSEIKKPPVLVVSPVTPKATTFSPRRIVHVIPTASLHSEYNPDAARIANLNTPSILKQTSGTEPWLLIPLASLLLMHLIAAVILIIRIVSTATEDSAQQNHQPEEWWKRLLSPVSFILYLNKLMSSWSEPIPIMARLLKAARRKLSNGEPHEATVLLRRALALHMESLPPSLKQNEFAIPPHMLELIAQVHVACDELPAAISAYHASLRGYQRQQEDRLRMESDATGSMCTSESILEAADDVVHSAFETLVNERLSSGTTQRSNDTLSVATLSATVSYDCLTDAFMPLEDSADEDMPVLTPHEEAASDELAFSYDSDPSSSAIVEVPAPPVRLCWAQSDNSPRSFNNNSQEDLVNEVSSFSEDPVAVATEIASPLATIVEEECLSATLTAQLFGDLQAVPCCDTARVCQQLAAVYSQLSGRILAQIAMIQSISKSTSTSTLSSSAVEEQTAVPQSPCERAFKEASATECENNALRFAVNALVLLRQCQPVDTSAIVKAREWIENLSPAAVTTAAVLPADSSHEDFEWITNNESLENESIPAAAPVVDYSEWLVTLHSAAMATA